MPGNKKNKRITRKPMAEYVSRIMIELQPNGAVKCYHVEKDIRATFTAFQSALMLTARQQVFDSVLPLWKQVRAIKRGMINHRSWFYRHVVALFI